MLKFFLVAHLTYENQWVLLRNKIRTFGFFGTPYCAGYLENQVQMSDLSVLSVLSDLSVLSVLCVLVDLSVLMTMMAMMTMIVVGVPNPQHLLQRYVGEAGNPSRGSTAP